MSSYLIKNFALPADQWTAITTPWYCKTWGLRNTGSANVILASDTNDTSAQDNLAPGAWELCTSGNASYAEGSILLYAKSVGTPGQISGRFVR